MAKNELAKVQEAGVPAVIDFDADAGSGFEEADQASYAIPFLKILQSMSPQVKKSDGAYIKGAEEGDLYNTVTNSVMKGDEGIVIVPCHYRRTILEWSAPLNEGGTFIGSHNAVEGDALMAQTTRTDRGNELPNGHILTDNREHYCIVVNPDGTHEPVLMALTSTQIKKSKKWMTMMNNITLKSGAIAPMYSQMYKLTTTPETSDQFSWFGVKIERLGPVQSAALYESAKKFKEMVRSGVAKADMTSETEPF